MSLHHNFQDSYSQEKIKKSKKKFQRKSKKGKNFRKFEFRTTSPLIGNFSYSYKYIP